MDLTHPLNCVTFNLQRATRSLMREFEAAAKQSGLTVPQFTTLSLLSGWGELSVTGLSERLGTDRTTLTRNLDVMARKGWIVEVPEADGRLHIWTLTESGHERLAAALPIWAEFQAGIVKRLGKEDAALLLETVAKLR